MLALVVCTKVAIQMVQLAVDSVDLVHRGMRHTRPVLGTILDIRLHQMLAKEAMHNAIHMFCAYASLTYFHAPSIVLGHGLCE